MWSSSEEGGSEVMAVARDSLDAIGFEQEFQDVSYALPDSKLLLPKAPSKQTPETSASVLREFDVNNLQYLSYLPPCRSSIVW